MKTKEEAIREAYGVHYPIIKNSLNENGYILNAVGTPVFVPSIGELDFIDDGFLFRPKSLQGIETNNGWIRIESEADLPKESGHYLIILKNIGIKIDFWKNYESEFELWNKDSITHYQPIIKPKPPIY